MTRRLFMFAGALVGIAAAGLVAVRNLPSNRLPPGITKANFDCIRKGMRRKEVEDILGGPSTHLLAHRAPDGPLVKWEKDHLGGVYIYFDRNERVGECYWIPDSTKKPAD